jgi:hypothetical protein
MKSLILFFTSLFCFLSLKSSAQNAVQIQQSDIAMLQGSWKGSLTYLDYRTGKPYTMPANTIISAIPQSNNLLVEMIYPDEPKANGKDTLKVNAGFSSFDDCAIISRKKLADGSIEIITTHKGKDGNDNKNAIIRKTYTIGKNKFTNRKDVQFEGTTEWIMRNEYSYTK